MKPQRHDLARFLVASVLALSTAVALFPGCGEEPPASLYDPDIPSGLTPVITSINPPPSDALAGATVVTIAGQNFSATPGGNLVLFNNVPGIVREASATQLKVLVPNAPAETVMVQVAVTGAEFYSNKYQYRLGVSVSAFGKFQATEQPWASTADASGNLYVSLLLDNGSALGIERMDTLGARTPFATMPTGGVTKRFTGMKIGPTREMFAVGLAAAIFRVPAAGGAAVPWAAVAGATLLDLDFDPSGNIWAGGTLSRRVYRVRPDRNVRSFVFQGDVRAVRYYDGYLYLGGRVYPDSIEAVSRMRVVNADSLEAPEIYFNVSTSIYASNFIYSINFDENGFLYIGTDASDPILRVAPDRTAEVFYPGLLTPSASQLTWGPGTHMYMTKADAVGGNVAEPLSIFKVDTQRKSAPYWGRP